MIRRSLVALVIAAALAALPAVAGELAVANAWSRSTPPVAKVGVVYFTLRNDTKKPDRLLKLSTPVAAKVEVHRTGRCSTAEEGPVGEECTVPGRARCSAKQYNKTV